jgi:hypothetical protein
VALTVPSDLARSTVPVLWSVTLSRLALSVAALVLAVRTHVPDYTAVYSTTYATTTPTGTPPLTVESGPEWVSRGAAIVLVVVWAGVEATVRWDPGWRQTVRRQRMMALPSVSPDLASTSLAQVTGAAAGIAAVSAGLLLVAEPLPEYFGDLAYLGDPTYPTDVGLLVGVQAVTFALLTAGVLAVGTPAAAGRTLLAGATAGVAAGLVTIGLIAYRLFGLQLEHMLGLVLVWMLVMLVVGGLAATPTWNRLRQRLGGLARRRRRPE